MQRVIFTLLFSCSLSFLMSAWVTFINLGLVNDYLHCWAIAFANAWPAAFFCAWILNKPITYLTKQILTRFTLK
ncbi:DUF2798 domain-containing protein [Paraglaciecola sp.]|uniref:DUF2798 domain-containing protein n=1 Tax=Paraglaciecola sp. TaxID=1920173 RepID=UPI0030F3A8D6